MNKTGARRGRGTGTDFGAPEERTEGIALPSNVINTQVSNESWHEAAFPTDLSDFFVKVYSKAGDVVFDPFAGSCTTLMSCQNLGRLGYGVELSPAYGDKALARMEEAFGSSAELVTRHRCRDKFMIGHREKSGRTVFNSTPQNEGVLAQRQSSIPAHELDAKSLPDFTTRDV